MQALLDAIAQMRMPQDAQRIFHGRGGLHPGCEQWTLDAYPPVWLLTSYQSVSEAELATVGEALAARWAELSPGTELNWVFQHRQDVRAETRLMSGSVPEPHVVTEDDARYRVHLLKGQNHGLFLDMAEGRRWVRHYVGTRKRCKVLNLFAYTCSFSVAAMQGGARQVVNMDMSGGALGIGKQNHQLNGFGSDVSFLPHDVFASWGKITRSGPYDLIVIDPPSYQKGSFVAEKDYARLMRRLPDLLMPDGHAMVCLNSPKLGVDFLQDLMRTEAAELTFVARLPNPAVFADVDEARSLKVLVYKAPPLSAA
jgi:23S rRNA (cytosine1962-C5)-methyltransferase